MSIYLTLTYITLTLSILTALLFIVLFFKWDFLDILETLTGAKRKRTLKDMDSKGSELNLNRDITSGVTSSLVYKGGDSTNKFIHDEIDKVNEEIKESQEESQKDSRTAIEKEFDELDNTMILSNTGVSSNELNDSEDESDKTEVLHQEVFIEETDSTELLEPSIQTGGITSDVDIFEEDDDKTEILEPSLLSTTVTNDTDELFEEDSQDKTSDLKEDNEESSIKIVNID